MRHDESGQLDVAKAAELLLKNIDHSKPKLDEVLLSRMAPEEADRLKRQHSAMIKEFRAHASAICAARGIPTPYVVDRARDLDSEWVFEENLKQHIQASEYGEDSPLEEGAFVWIPEIDILYTEATKSCGECCFFRVRMGAPDDAPQPVIRFVIVPAVLGLDTRAFLVHGHPGELRAGPDDQNDEQVQQSGVLYHELGHVLFQTDWTKKKMQYVRLGRGDACPPPEAYDIANWEMMADMTEMAFRTQCTGNMKAAKEVVAQRWIDSLRGGAVRYMNTVRLAAFLPKLACAGDLDNAGILSLLKKEFETCLWTEESFEQNRQVQQAAKDWLKNKALPSSAEPVPARLHIHDCVEALCSLYKAEPAEMGIRPVRPAVPAIKPQM